jgi:ribosomal protein S18 acetylase RimI-like enzyme
VSIDPASVSIRPARKSDAAAIAQLVAQLATFLQESSAVSEEYVLRYLESGEAGVLVAAAEGEVIGVLSYTLRPSLYHAATSCMIEELVVSEGYRRTGIGSRLLNTIVALAREKGCVEVSISAMASNRGAIDLYKRHGFEADAVLLEKHLQRED